MRDVEQVNHGGRRERCTAWQNANLVCIGLTEFGHPLDVIVLQFSRMESVAAKNLRKVTSACAAG